ncbi:hypothetical protein PG301_29050 [Parageobacillus sp. G301]|nr:hypothetical protein PG301_29050 [Parageobacillus sp. G301]
MNIIDYFLIVFGALIAYGTWKHNESIVDAFWLLATAVAILLSKRYNSRFWSMIAYLGTSFYFFSALSKPLHLNVLSMVLFDKETTLFFSIVALITMASFFLQLTTYGLSFMWAVFYVLNIYVTLSQHGTKEFIDYYNSNSVIYFIIQNYMSIFLLSFIGCCFIEYQFITRRQNRRYFV